MSATRHALSVRRLLMAAGAPASLALALAAGPAMAANNTPVPSVPPPASGSNWSGVFIDSSYDPTSTNSSITATAARAYAEWTEFNVTPGSTFNVEGMSQDWIIVNRVVSVGPGFASDISGNVNANGQFWLINPNGIVVSQTGNFDVGGLLLSTATGFDTSNFLSGSGLTWSFTGATQPIVVNGTVIANHGVVALLAPQVTIGDSNPSSDAGAIVEGGSGQAQVVAIAAQDVSLAFAEDGNQLYQLDGATIQRGVAGSGPGTVGGVAVNASATLTAGRIFIAAGGETAPVDVLITGSITATQARQDGQDIVLMTTDLAPVGSPQTVADGHVSGGPNGPVHDAAVTSAGGYVLLDPLNINTVVDPSQMTNPNAAFGAGVMVRASGTALLGDVVNPVGDLDIAATGQISSVLGKGSLSAVDIALRSPGSITTGDLNARDDVVVRAGGAFTAGAIHAGVEVLDQDPTDPSFSDATEAGERLVASTGPLSFVGHDFDLVGHDVDVVAGTIQAGAVTASDAGASSLSSPLSDVRLDAFSAVGTLSVGDVTAPRDILLDAYGDTQAGVLVAGRDIAANSTVGSLVFTSGDAQDDIVLGAGGALIVSGDLTTHGQDSSAPDQVGDLLALSGPIIAFSPQGPGATGPASFDVVGSDIDALAGSIRVGGTSTAPGPGSDARFQAPGSIALGDVQAGQDVLIDGGTAVVTGTLTAGQDVGVRAYSGSMTTQAIDAQDDVVLRAAGGVKVNGAITVHGQDSVAADQAGDLLSQAAPFTAFSAAGPGGSGGTSFDVSGSTIDVVAGGAITVSGLVDAVGVEPSLNAPNGSDVRFQTPGAVTLAGVQAGRDVFIDAGQDVAVTQTLLAGRDVAVRSTGGSLTISGASADAAVRAGDDIVLRAAGDVSVTGRLATYAANDPSSPGQAGDLLAAVDPVTLNSFSFGVANGADIDVLAKGAILIGPNGSGPADYGSAQGGDGSDVRLQAGGAVTLNDVMASQDILIDAGETVSTGDLTAGRDVAARSYGGALTVGFVDAQDDIVLRSGPVASSGGGIAANGLTTHGANDASDAGQAGDLLFAVDPMSLSAPFSVANGSDVDLLSHNGDIVVVGAIDAWGDARLQTDGNAPGGDVLTAEVTSQTGDVLLDGADVGPSIDVPVTLVALDGDVAVRGRTGSVTVDSIEAGDDVVLRAAGALTVGGGVSAGGAADAAGAGDQLAAVDPMLASWSASASPIGETAGGDIDVRAGGAVTLGGAAVAHGPGADVRLDSGGAMSLTSVQLAGGGAGGLVLIGAASLSLPGQINAPGADLVLVAHRTALSGGGFAPAVLGGPAGGAGTGFGFDSGEISRTNVRSLTMFSGTDPAASANLVVRDVQYSTTLRTIRVYAGPGSRIDVAGQVTDPVGTDARFQAGAAPGDAGAPSLGQGSDAAPISGAWTPDVIRVSGGLGVGGNALADVRLEARSIYIAPASDPTLSVDFESAVQSRPPELLPAYAGPATLQIRAGRLDLRAADAILERNLAPSGAADKGQGLQLGGLTIDSLGTGATPSRISLFGALDSRLAGVLPPPAPDVLIDGIAAAYLLTFAPTPGSAVGYPAPSTLASYRFNGCIFGGGAGCLDQLPNGQGGIGGIGGPSGTIGGVNFALAQAAAAAAAEADSGAEGAPGLANPSVVTQAVDPFAPVEEEPVTNTGGEITWPAPGAPTERKR